MDIIERSYMLITLGSWRVKHIFCSKKGHSFIKNMHTSLNQFTVWNKVPQMTSRSAWSKEVISLIISSLKLTSGHPKKKERSSIHVLKHLPIQF